MPTKKTKRTDGRYQVSIVTGRNEKGVLQRKYFYGKTQKEAAQKKKAYLDGLALDVNAKKMTVARWAQIWLANYSKGGFRNQENNKSIVNTFIMALELKASIPISEIRPVDIQTYASSIKNKSKSHVNKCKYVINQIFQTAKDNGYVNKSPCEGISWEGVKNGTRNALDKETIRKITENWHVHPAGVWAMFVLYSGIRPSEAFALRRENISENDIIITDGSHFEHGQLVIVPGQVKSEAGQRTIPIVSPLRPVIKSLPSEGLVCTSTKGLPVSQSAYKRNWAAFCNKIGIKTDMYSLRHTYCSFLYDADVDIETAQRLMGHADLMVTMKIYTHLSKEKKQRSYDSLHKFFDAK